ncbi:MAG: caspase family protein [Candidatus Moraniibacteriota bacterium]
MKKIGAVVFAMVLFFSTGNVLAKDEVEKSNATDIKIHKKKVLSDEERKALEGTKGKPTRPIDDGTFTSLATGEIGSSLPVGGQKYALVIGLANYSGTVNDLCVAAAKTADQFPESNEGLSAYCQDSDSLHMQQALIEEYGYDEVAILRDGSATKANILAEMEKLKAKLVGGDDEVTFFFSGHGVSGKYLGIVDKEKVDEAVFTYDNQFIWDDDLKKWADSLSVYRAVFAFDICLAGGMNDLAGDNRILAMSSGETESSNTYYLGGAQTDTNVFQQSEGFFSHYFVKRGMFNYEGVPDGSNLLSEGDLNKYDQKVSVEEAFSYAYPLVKIKQSPVLNDKFSNDLLL